MSMSQWESKLLLSTALFCLAHTSYLSLQSHVADNWFLLNYNSYMVVDKEDSGGLIAAIPTIKQQHDQQQDPLSQLTGSSSTSAFQGFNLGSPLLVSSRTTLWLPLVVDILSVAIATLHFSLSKRKLSAAHPLEKWIVFPAHILCSLMLAITFSLTGESVAASRANVYFIASAMCCASASSSSLSNNSSTTVSGKSSSRKKSSNSKNSDSKQSVWLQLPRRVLMFLIHALLLAITISITIAASLRFYDYTQTTPPPGVLVPIREGAHRVHAHCSGIKHKMNETFSKPSATIILEAGLGEAGSEVWGSIPDLLASKAQVCWYDRPGYGWSESGPSPMTATASVETLRLTLQAIGVSGPYVLVGRGYGALLGRIHSKMYPGEVAGLVMLDPWHEDMWDRTEELLQYNNDKVSEQIAWRSLKVASNATAWMNFLSPFGLDRLFYNPLAAIAATTTPLLVNSRQQQEPHLRNGGKRYRAALSELRQIQAGVTRVQAQWSRPPKSRPREQFAVTVLSLESAVRGCDDVPPSHTNHGKRRASFSNKQDIITAAAQECLRDARKLKATVVAECHEDLATALAVHSEHTIVKRGEIADYGTIVAGAVSGVLERLHDMWFSQDE